VAFDTQAFIHRCRTLADRAESVRLPLDTNYQGEYKKGHFTRAQIRGKDGSLYMDRWYLLVFPRLFSIRIHHICRPDLDRWPHDHPWWFISIILRGGYREWWCKRTEFRTMLTNIEDPFAPPKMAWMDFHQKQVRRFNFHTNTDLHMIREFDRGEKGAWTLIFTGPEKREWGFMTDQGWVSRVALNLGASAPREKHGPEPD
jgi:hypothetical protein